jgi:G:T/U-mismatch repair DNA glycosylase
LWSRDGQDTKRRKLDNAKRRRLDHAKRRKLDNAKRRRLDHAKRRKLDNAKRRRLDHAMRRKLDNAKRRRLDNTTRRRLDNAKRRRLELILQKWNAVREVAFRGQINRLQPLFESLKYSFVSMDCYLSLDSACHGDKNCSV